MKHEEQHHEELIQGISRQMKSILEDSQQAIYIYLDDIHKVCNEKFASLMGYGSPEEWAKVKESFEAFVERSRPPRSHGLSRALSPAFPLARPGALDSPPRHH